MNLLPSFFLIVALMLCNAYAEKDCSGIKFFLHSTRHKDGEEFTSASKMAASKNWRPNKPVVVLIHSWMEKGKKDFWRIPQLEPLQSIKEAYLDEKRPDNIIMVDWNKYAKEILDKKKLDIGAICTGSKTAELLLSLQRHEALQGGMASVHIIGFGYGADIAGIAGSLVQDTGAGKIARITALDGRFKRSELSKSDKTRLDSSDAEFVDAIHCSIFPLNFDKPDNIQRTAFAHVDFFPEGGVHQEGCKPWLKFLDIKYLSATCSHLACPRLYAKSVRRYKFHGCRCSDQEEFDKQECDCEGGPLMGEFCDASARGSYYAETSHASKMYK